MRRVLLCMLVLLFVVPGCMKKEARMQAYFVRGGLAVELPGITTATVLSEGTVVFRWQKGVEDKGAVLFGGDKLFLPVEWSAGEKYSVEARNRDSRSAVEVTAPLKPSPMLIHRVQLEDVIPFSIDQGTAPDTFVKFSGDNRYLAIGSFHGYLRVVDVKTGRVILSKKIAEGMVKRIGWGKIDGQRVLYAGEQSPDGYIYCLDAMTGTELWKYRLADDIETSRPERENDRYAVYKFPGVYRLKVLPGGDVVIVGTHGWDIEGRRRYRCMVYRFDGRTGRIKWRWPADRTLPYGLTWFDISDDGGRLLLLTSTWRPPGQSDPVYENGTLYCLSGDTGAVLWEYRVPPLRPYYERATAWQGVALSADGRYAVIGLNDGRGMFFDTRRAVSVKGRRFPQNSPLWVKEIGTPVLIGDIPVSSPVSYAGAGREEVYFVLPGTSIPSGAVKGKVRKPAPHPAAGQLYAFGLDGRLRWKWKSYGSMQGIYLSGDSRWLFTVNALAGMAGSRRGGRTSTFGVTLFDTSGRGPETGKPVYLYPTEGPVFFMADISEDGRYIALVEVPFADENGIQKGSYRVHIIH
ncbi:MAG: PQQ-like beta-propeller repeat protein [Deferribacteres bacterium]|nr:PQQ-like beta-propeller repeat protein [Deferribacteres bacterium]